MSLVSDYRACQDLPARQAFLFQHCQDVIEKLKEYEGVIEGQSAFIDTLEEHILQLQDALKKHKAVEERLVRRIKQLKEASRDADSSKILGSGWML